MIDKSENRIFASRVMVWSTCLALMFTICLVNGSWYDRLYWSVMVGLSIATLAHLYFSIRFAANVKRKSHKIPFLEILKDLATIVNAIILGWWYHQLGGLADDPILDCTLMLCPYLY